MRHGVKKQYSRILCSLLECYLCKENQRYGWAQRISEEFYSSVKTTTKPEFSLTYFVLLRKSKAEENQFIMNTINRWIFPLFMEK